MTNVLIVLTVGLGTYLTRLSFIGLVGSRQLPETIRRGLEYIAPAVLAALVFPALIRPEGVADLTPGNVRLIAGIVAEVVAWRTRSIAATTIVGLGVLWILQAIV